jgi:hypothetical protein
MTIQLLHYYDGLSPDVYTLAGEVETRLIGLGLARAYTPGIDGKNTVFSEPQKATALALLIGSSRRAGNLTTGVGADLVFSGAGGVGAGKLNTGVDIRIPANTLVPGTSFMNLSVHARRTGTDASFIDLRFGSTNGTSDGVMLAAAQFNAGADPGDVIFEVTSSVTDARLTTTGQVSMVNVAATGTTVTELASLDFTVDNYITVVVAGCTTGSYRVVSWEMQVF